MAVIRRNILKSSSARNGFTQGVKLLKAEASGRTTADFGIPGSARSVSTYDLFVIWHHNAMMAGTPPGNSSGRNAAHRGPVFCPWHRVMLMLLEQNLQRVLSDTTFGLPYWDWASDGDKPAAKQKKSAVWKASCMGGEGDPVATGPFAFSNSDSGSWRVRVESDISGDLVSTNRGLRRSFAQDAPRLPNSAHVTSALALSDFDGPNWSADAPGFRNRLEGWSADSVASPPWLHNLVHVWVGGDMAPASSPNDPVFYLNHCNVDRIWERWLQKYGRTYVPAQNVGAALKGHRIDDPIASPLGGSATPRQVLDMSSIYAYDVLPS